MTLFSRLAATASRQLAEKGESVTFTRTVPGTFNPATGETTGSTTTTFTAKAYPSGFGFALKNGESIQAGDKRLTMESGNKPQTGDIATLSDGDMTVVDFDTVGLTNDAVIYVVQLRS